MTEAPGAGRAAAARRAAHRASRNDGSGRPPRRRRRAATLRCGSARADLRSVGGGWRRHRRRHRARCRPARACRSRSSRRATSPAQTSSRSSKLIHGGLRYLQYGDLPLVFEGLTERARLMRIAPHLCRPIEFLFPAYRGERPGLADPGRRASRSTTRWRSGARRPARRRTWRPRDLSARSRPAQRGARGRAALRRLPDRRRAAGAGERARRRERRRGRRQPRAGRSAAPRPARPGARRRLLVDRETGARFEVRAPRSSSARPGPSPTASWRPAPPRLRPTLGVHLVFDAARVCPRGRALVLRTPRDNRLFFILPAARARSSERPTPTGGHRGSEPPPRVGDEIRARGGDVAYLLGGRQPRLPAAAPGARTTCCLDLRGAAAAPRHDAHTPSETSREHDIVRAPDGVIVVAGGKLTTLRRMGEADSRRRAVALAARAGFERRLAPCATARTRPCPGGGAAARRARERCPRRRRRTQLASPTVRARSSAAALAG